jgi:hypothetical protein
MTTFDVTTAVTAYETYVVESPPEVKAWTAADVKAALRRRHPGDPAGSMPGQWTCIEEWLGIDLLALNAWQKADVIGYEVKISRSDLRRELLKPHKRSRALAATTEFYLAVPAGLLSDDEIAYEEPKWAAGDFERPVCTNEACEGSRYGRRRRREKGSDWEAATVTVAMERGYGGVHACCVVCRGRGTTGKSRVEREAPTCWVPRDVGLVTISARGCRLVKRSPRRKDPKPIAPTRQKLNDLVRWVSHRPDPRHRS